MTKTKASALVAGGIAVCLGSVRAQPGPDWLPLDVIARTAASRDADARPALDLLAKQWRTGYAPMLLDLAEMSRAPRASAPPHADSGGGSLSQPAGVADAEELARTPADPVDRPPERPAVSPVRMRLLRFLERPTGQRFGLDFTRWHQWIWSQPYDPHPDLALFKGLLYANVDPRMRDFFPPGVRGRSASTRSSGAASS